MYRAEDDFPVQVRRAKSPFFCLLVLFRATVNWVMPSCIGEGYLLFFSKIIFYFSIIVDIGPSSLLNDSNANPFQKHPHRHTQKCFASSQGILQPKVTYKINHHSVSTEVIKAKWGHQGGPSSNMTSILIERENLTQRHTWRKDDMKRPKEKMATYEPRREAWNMSLLHSP